MRYAVRWLTVMAAAALVAGCTAPPDMAGHWSDLDDGYAAYAAQFGEGPVIEPASTGEVERWVLSHNGVLRGLEAAVARNGDVLALHVPAAGFAVVETANPAAYARYASIITRDRMRTWREPGERVALTDAELLNGTVGDPPFSGACDWLFDLQWGHVPVGATAAWAAGVRGQGVTVAVLDEGFDLTHVDLAPNIVGAYSTVFGLPDDPMYTEPPQYLLPDAFSHGSHVAGTIAAAQNCGGVVGVAPDAELILIKVLSEVLGGGLFSWVNNGILLAADLGADIINMSLGGSWFKQDPEWAAERVIGQRAVNYATWRGTLVVTSAGNAALDFDQASDWLVLPAELARVVTVSATAPVGWATYFQDLGPTAAGFDPAGFDRLASYSNYGRSVIDVSGPGGDGAYPGDEFCVIGPLDRPCWVFDLVFSSGSQGAWYWSGGTSMASPHAAGVAALILSEHGGSGSLSPTQLEAELKARGTTYGRWAPDPVHGMGAVQSGY